MEADTQGLEIFQAVGHRYYVAVQERCLGIIHWKRGRLGKAGDHAEASLAAAAALSVPLDEWYAALLQGMILLHSGDFDRAANSFRSGKGWDLPRETSRPSLLTTEFLGDIHLEQGEAEAALKLYDEVWPKALALVPKGDIVAELRRRRAECLHLLGRHDEAYAEAQGGLDHCRELGDRYEEAATYRVLALTAAAVGKLDEAKKWFEQGFAYYEDIETPYEWGKLWMAYGDWLSGAAAGDYRNPRAAEHAYEAARDHFEGMGALAKFREAQARLAALRGQEPPIVAEPHASAPDAARRRAARRPRGSAELERRADWAFEVFGLVTRSSRMLSMLEEVEKLSRSGTPILVVGESGTGKELIAKGVHRLSKRAGSFLPINCGALPREIVESELFGHVAGSFTGASREKAGLLEVCAGGTVFLDEVGEMAIELQSRLLRFLETGEVRRVGANSARVVDTRVVAATNRDRAALERGDGFRVDLYYRLAHAVVELPPLRRRGDDAEFLAMHFLEEACRDEGKDLRLTPAARKRIKSYAWPGNVRQLRAVIRRVVLLASGREVGEGELRLEEGSAPATLLEELAHAERQRIVEALQAAKGSRTEAARALGIPRTTLINKLKRFGIS